MRINKIWMILLLVIGMTGCMKKQEKKAAKLEKITMPEKEMADAVSPNIDLGYGYQAYRFDLPEDAQTITVHSYHLNEQQWELNGEMKLQNPTGTQGTIVIVNGINHSLYLYLFIDGYSADAMTPEYPLHQLAAGSFLFEETKKEIVQGEEIPIYLERYYPSHIQPLKDLSTFFETEQFHEDYLSLGITIQFD